MESEQASHPSNRRDDSGEFLRLFQAQKAQEESRAPAFATVWGAAQARSRKQGSAPVRNLGLRWAVGAAFAAVALGILLVRQIPEIAGPGSDSEAVSLARWESPTGPLLSAYGTRAPVSTGMPPGARAPELSLSTWRSPTAYLETPPVAASLLDGDERSKRWSWYRERQGWNL